MTEALLSYFGIGSHWDFDQFVDAMDVFINMPAEIHNKMTFESYDFNGDGSLSEFDLFLAMKSIQNDLFVEVLCSDITSILNLIQGKKNFTVGIDDQLAIA